MGITKVSYHYTYCCLVLDINYRKKTAPAIMPQRDYVLYIDIKEAGCHF